MNPSTSPPAVLQVGYSLMLGSLEAGSERLWAAWRSLCGSIVWRHPRGAAACLLADPSCVCGSRGLVPPVLRSLALDSGGACTHCPVCSASCAHCLVHSASCSSWCVGPLGTPQGASRRGKWLGHADPGLRACMSFPILFLGPLSFLRCPQTLPQPVFTDTQSFHLLT